MQETTPCEKQGAIKPTNFRGGRPSWEELVALRRKKSHCQISVKPIALSGAGLNLKIYKIYLVGFE
jgi:hypothetical protein